MVADGIHILLAVPLVALLLGTDRVEVYLIGILAAGIPDLDRYRFSPFICGGHLSGQIWTHRGITHSLVALLLFVGAAHLVGQWRAAAIGYGSYLVADFLTGSVRLFAPLSVRPYGLYCDWGIGNVVAGAFAALVILAELAVRLCDGDETAGFTGEPGTEVTCGVVQFWRQFRWRRGRSAGRGHNPYVWCGSSQDG